MNIKALGDIYRLIDDRIEEGLTLKYKKDLGNNHDIAKEVCALANSEGGTLIYGVISKDRIPTGLSWIEGDNVEERIQNVISASIQPKFDGLCVFPYPNPDGHKQAVFVVEVPRSPSMPHMTNSRYYKRRGSVSSPMEHDEIKNAMLGPGRIAALHFEISANLELLDKTCHLLERLSSMPPGGRKRIVLVPLHTDAWHAIVASGLLVSFPKDTIEKLLEAYAIIHEVNTLIDSLKRVDWLKREEFEIVYFVTDDSSWAQHGTYIPAIIRHRMTGKLGSLLDQIKESL
ncbi:ATP-binding protein [Dehalococcoidia bacterium]|nr:ATP-binding protein [Dehalococcoidia bacterium]